MRLVLLPGLDGTGELFAPFTDALAGVDVQVISYPPDRPMNYAGHEAHVRERLPKSEDYVLLAESFSGPVGISIAASAPANLRGLILCCSFASNPLPVFGPLSRLIGFSPAVKIPNAWAAPWLYAGHATSRLRELHAKAMSIVSATAMRARVAALLAVDFTTKLRDVKAPLLYLLATEDRLVPRSAFEKIRELRPETEMREFNAPHFLLQSAPLPVSEVVRAFLLR